MPQYDELYASAFVVLALLGELPLTFWLLIKGVNVERWEKRALESDSGKNMRLDLPELASARG